MSMTFGEVMETIFKEMEPKPNKGAEATLHECIFKLVEQGNISYELAHNLQNTISLILSNERGTKRFYTDGRTHYTINKWR